MKKALLIAAAVAGGGFMFLIAVLVVIGLALGETDTDAGQEPVAVESTEPEPEEPKQTTKPKEETQEVKPSKPATKPKPSTPAAQPEPKAVKVQAGRMIEQFEGNEAAADARYKGKTVQVTGHVEKVDTEFWNEDEYIIQLSGGDEWAILTVNCNDVSAEQAAKVQPGSTITVRGEFDDGGDLGVEVKDCRVL